MVRVDEPRLDYWDVVAPNGRGPEESIEPVHITLQRRKLEVDPSRRSILVSERKMRVGSRGIEREGLPTDIVTAVENEFRSDKKNDGKNLSDAHFRAVRDSPLLLLHFLQGIIAKRNSEREVISEEIYAVEGGPLFAIGLSFPKFDDSKENRRVRYRVNLVEWRNMFGGDQGDDEDNEDDDA